MSPRSLSLAAGILALGLAASGGPRLKHLDAEDFLEQAEEIGAVNSASWTSYVGSSAGYAYLERGRATWDGQGAKTILFWTELEGLPEGLAEQLGSGVDPWASEGKAR